MYREVSSPVRRSVRAKSITAFVVISMLAVASNVILAHRAAGAAPQDKYNLRIVNGPAFSEFKGYEDWTPWSPSVKTED